MGSEGAGEGGRGGRQGGRGGAGDGVGGGTVALAQEVKRREWKKGEMQLGRLSPSSAPRSVAPS
jgi:hypothetical protein